jgi:hypothetical protein
VVWRGWESEVRSVDAASSVAGSTSEVFSLGAWLRSVSALRDVGQEKWDAIMT